MINSIIGESTKLKGDFELDGTLRIDGTFHGTIKGNTEILIGEKGKAYFNLEASEIVIGGYVEGDITVLGKMTILSTGALKGTVKAGYIEIEPGGLFNAQCSMIKKLEKTEESE